MLKSFDKKTPSPAPESAKIKKIDPPSSIEGCEIVYDYDNVEMFIPKLYTAPLDYSMININDRLTGVQTPWELDSESISLWLENPDYHYIIGHLDYGEIKDMFNDWAKKGKPTYILVSDVDEANDSIKIRVTFYDKIEKE